MIDAHELLDAEIGQARSCIQQNVIVYQQAGGETFSSTNSSGTSKYLQFHHAAPGLAGQFVVCGASRETGHAAHVERITSTELMTRLPVAFLNDCRLNRSDCGFFVSLMLTPKIKPRAMIHFRNAIHYDGRICLQRQMTIHRSHVHPPCRMEKR
ncbi:hypothetical protein [Noviherbaspirillum denitrificans]|uniref:hypothetical protein n=1 Tax=Noviherbaspirillum denitrificans TaxID=1968433 RepID=UPI0014830B70|nr:hypothetical protein [Noviherbaspirillum denitrificans]